MTNVIQIKRSTVTNTPSSLAVGELAYSEASNTLFIGGTSNAILEIGGLLGSKVQPYSSVLAATTASFTTAQQTKLNGIETGAEVTSTAKVASAGAVMHTDISSNGLVVRTSAGNYSSIANNSSNWNTAYGWGDHAAAGYAVAANLHGVATSGNYNDLINKPDLSALEEVFAYDTLNSFPTTGEVNKVYIAEDTGTIYRWSGSAYIAMSDQTAIWGQIGGTLSEQTDLNNTLNAKLNSSAYTAADVKSKYESNPDTNVFTDAEKSKLASVELNANAGTVTSVGVSVPTGFTSSGGPVTESGTISIGFASGFSLPTTTKQGNWDTAFGWGNHATAGYLTSSSSIDGGTF